MQSRVIEGMTRILTQANYVRIDHNDVEQILTRESAYGLDLQVDLDVFEEVLLFYRGASSKRDAAPPLAQVLPARAVRHPDLPAPVPAVQAEAVRRPRARGDEGPEAQPPRGREDRQARARGHAARGQGKLHLHEAVQEHPEKRSRDDLSEHARALPLFRQAAPRRDCRRRLGSRRSSARPARSRCWRRTRSRRSARSSASAASPSARASTS